MGGQGSATGPRGWAGLWDRIEWGSQAGAAGPSGWQGLHSRDGARCSGVSCAVRGWEARPDLAGQMQAGTEPMRGQGLGVLRGGGRTGSVPPLMGSQKADAGYCVFGLGVPRVGGSLRKNTLCPLASGKHLIHPSLCLPAAHESLAALLDCFGQPS